MYNTVHGCDSTIVTDLLVIEEYIIHDTIEICDGESYFIGGGDQIVSGSYTDSYISQGGCDSIVITELIVKDIYSTSLVANICEGDSILLGGVLQTLEGTYYDTLTALNGCDSVLVTELSYYPNYVVNEVGEICEGDSVLLGGTWQFETGIYADTLSSIHGCDSIIMTSLTVLEPVITDLSLSSCEGDSILIGTIWYYETGLYYDTLVAFNGCDSILSNGVTFHPNSLDTVVVEICEGESYLAGGILQTETGYYTDVYNTVHGCDSTIVTDLLVKPVYETYDTVEICNGDSYYVGGGNQTLGGSYTDVYQALNGCDSTVITELTFKPQYIANVVVEICIGETYFVGGAEQSTAGQYTDVYQAMNGCDSTIVTQLNIRQRPTSNVDVFICQGDSILIGNDYQTNPGTYTDTIYALDGCDSVVYVQLNWTPATYGTSSMLICLGDSVLIGGEWRYESGFYQDTLASAVTSCDSINTVHLQVFPDYQTNYDYSICQGDSLLIGDTWYFAGVYSNVYTGWLGCDSIVNLDIKELPEYQFTDSITICEGESVLINGSLETEEGWYENNYYSFSGCDSIHRVHLTVLPDVDIWAEGSGEICLGDTLQLHMGGSVTSYTWYPTEGLSCTDCPDPYASPDETTTYTVSALNCRGETISASATVVINPGPEIDLGLDVSLILGDSTLLQAEGYPMVEFFDWYDDTDSLICEDCTETWVGPERTTTYTVYATDLFGCTNQKNVTVFVNDDCSYADLQIPNMISPNGDGNNDEFVIYAEAIAEIKFLRIYNRWGELIFETTDLNTRWDGTFRGQPLNPGVYTYYLQGICLNNEEFLRVGNVTILK